MLCHCLCIFVLNIGHILLQSCCHIRCALCPVFCTALVLTRLCCLAIVPYACTERTRTCPLHLLPTFRHGQAVKTLNRNASTFDGITGKKCMRRNDLDEFRKGVQQLRHKRPTDYLNRKYASFQSWWVIGGKFFLDNVECTRKTPLNYGKIRSKNGFGLCRMEA